MGIAKKVKEPPVIIKKIQAYPIPIQLSRPDGTPPISANILRLNTLGLQLSTTQILFKVGDDVKVSFTIPLHNNLIEDTMRVMKTTDSYKDINTREKHYITELHFKRLSPEFSKYIREFMFAIKQKN